MKFRHFLHTLSFENTIKSYYQYNDEQLKLHLSKWKEVEILGQNNMITHDDINEVITNNFKISATPLTLKQKIIQTQETLKIIDDIIEPQLKKNKIK